MLSPEDIEKLLQSLKEAVTDEEKQRILDLLAAHENELMQHLEQEFRAAAHEPTADQPGKAATYEYLLQQTGQSRTRTRHLKWWGRAAAAVLLLAGGSLLFLPRDPQPGIVAGAAPAMDTLYNAEKREVSRLFPDGSEVKLTPGSYVCYQHDFAHDKQVYLHGAGTFTIQYDAEHPFAVHVGALEIKDLGTVFYIRDQPDSIKVKLLQGKVLIHGLKDDIIMAPGELFAMEKQHQSFKVIAEKTVAKPTEKARSYHLHFENAGLAEVFKVLEGRFNRKIKYKPEDISDKVFTGNLANQATIENAIKLICIANDLQYEVEGDAIIIH